MLAGIKFVDKELAARSIEADRKASKKEKKLLKKVRFVSTVCKSSKIEPKKN